MGVITLAVASLVIAAGSAYASTKASAKALSQRKKASATAEAQNQVTQQSNIRDQVRQQRIRTSQIMQGSADTGTTGSSGELGGVSALASQSGSNIGTLNGQTVSQNAILADQNAAAGDMGRAATWGAVGGLASSSFNVFSNTPQFKSTMNNLFS